MNILEAIKDRKSCRAFRPDPVPKETLVELVKTCLYAPSWGNSQSWQFAIVGGKTMEELKRRLTGKIGVWTESRPDIVFSPEGGVFEARHKELGKGIFEVAAIARDDKDRRKQHQASMITFFGAPSGIIISTDRAMGTYGVLDVGIVAQTIMLAAREYGLDTCAEAAVVRFPDVLRDLLHIPESKLIVVGLAIGYLDTAAPINRFRSKRDPLDAFATWHGFE